ncbi:MAG TPA: 23S rRNA (pseudouridine(1915)-N(3))-methyltransferase RlmH [Calditerricola sp.]
MQVTVVSVGKVKEAFLKEGVAEYAKRLQPYASLRLIEVPDEPVPDRLSAREAEQIKEKEGRRLLERLHPDDYVIALALDGAMWSSEELAAELGRLATYGRSRVAFLIGGTLGLSPAVLKRADARLSLSRMTFPHQLVRLILLEQLYRAFKIQRGEPYHR